MNKKVELTKDEKREYLKEFYEYFDTGYEFEEFLKTYLEKIGLDEVSVTRKAKDGGIDLKAVRNGIGGFSDIDAVEYYVQAKRYKPESTISVTKIRELKGVIPFGHKGIFITTAKFSKDAIEESKNDISKPVILIDGENLIQSCIDNELGFVFKPILSKDELDSIKEKNITDSVENENTITVERQITANDIRARILVVPKVIMNAIPKEQEKIFVKLNKDEEKELTVDKGRRYLAGVTDFYREFKLLAEDGSCNPKKAIWKYSDGIIKITLKD